MNDDKFMKAYRDFCNTAAGVLAGYVEDKTLQHSIGEVVLSGARLPDVQNLVSVYYTIQYNSELVKILSSNNALAVKVANNMTLRGYRSKNDGVQGIFRKKLDEFYVASSIKCLYPDYKFDACVVPVKYVEGNSFIRCDQMMIRLEEGDYCEIRTTEAGFTQYFCKYVSFVNNEIAFCLVGESRMRRVSIELVYEIIPLWSRSVKMNHF